MYILYQGTTENADAPLNLGFWQTQNKHLLDIHMLDLNYTYFLWLG